jgi:hypothetical protein
MWLLTFEEVSYNEKQKDFHADFIEKPYSARNGFNSFFKISNGGTSLSNVSNG